MSDRLKLPPNRDFGFYQRRKHDKWREVSLPEPTLESAVADSHAHIHMLPDPAWELARCAANGVDFVCMIVDPSEDGSRPFDELDAWERDAEAELAAVQDVAVSTEQSLSCSDADSAKDCQPTALKGSRVGSCGSAHPLEGRLRCPTVRVAVGIHPHNARLYDEAIERELVRRLADSRVVALGEIGLDYHYDLSPREVQRSVFRRQLALAKEAGLPVALHLRGGDPEADAGESGDSRACSNGNAHREAFEILQEEGFPERGVLVHCCTLSPDELRPWIDAGCYIAYGGAITFKKADEAREGTRLVPVDRLLLETDSPYMTPEPMRGAACTPAHVVFTAAALAEIRGITPGAHRRAFLDQLHANTLAFYAPNA